MKSDICPHGMQFSHSVYVYLISGSRNVSRGQAVSTDPINLSTKFMTSLGKYVGTSTEEASSLVGKFLYMFMKDCQMLEAFEVDNFVLRNASMLCSRYAISLNYIAIHSDGGARTSVWMFYDVQVASLSSIRPNILLHLLAVEPQPFQALLDTELAVSNAWDVR